MVQKRKETPPEIIREIIFYRDGEIYYTPEYLKDHPRCKSGALGSVDKADYKSFAFYLNGKMRKFYVHRLIFWLNTGEWPETVDHIDRNRLNNNISNLRAATIKENSSNRISNPRSNTPFVGVHKTIKDGYRLCVNINGKQYTINGYKTPEAAALARDMLAHIFYGKFANLNILGDLVINVKTPENIAYPKESVTPEILELLTQQ
ncbi:TPA: HNH endonuclease [Escherichia coli]|nr:HNH endonuclease [Escherichia coli]